MAVTAKRRAEIQKKLSLVTDQEWIDFSDSAIGKKCKCSKVPARIYRKSNNKPKSKFKPISIDWDNVGLGTMPDEELADKIGRSFSSVRRQRLKFGIPKHFGDKSLAYANPDLSAQWVRCVSDESLTPSNVKPGSMKRVEWQCSKNKEHIWESAVNDRSKGHGCPYCCNKAVNNENNLAVMNPELAMEWIRCVSNDTLTPYHVTPGSNRKVEWQCSKNKEHIWESAVNARSNGSGCPHCYKEAGENNLAAMNPELAREWIRCIDDESLTPSNVTPGSGIKVEWQCSKNKEHIWESAVYSRSRGKGCPICNRGWSAKHILAVVEQLFENYDSLTPEEWLQFAATRGITGQGLAYIKDFAKGGPPEERQRKIDKLRKAAKAEEDGGDSGSSDNPDIEQDEDIGKNETDGQNPDKLKHGNYGDNASVENILHNTNEYFPHDSEHISRYFIDHQVARLWKHAYRDCDVAIAEAKAFKGNPYPTMVRDRFLDEYNKSTSIKMPDGYRFKIDGEPIKPRLMQWHVVQQVRDNRRVGNWSGTGSGKTLSAIMSSVVIRSRVTLILCPTVVVDTWKKAIKCSFNGCEVKVEDWSPVWGKGQKERRFLIFGYGKIQVPQAKKHIKKLIREQEIDMVVVDEIQYVKHRKDYDNVGTDAEAVDADEAAMDKADLKSISNRREVVLRIVSDLSKRNRELAVLGMSATPIVNNLQEGKSIIDIIMAGSQEKLLDLGTNSRFIEDCMAMHRQFVHLGTRYKQSLDIDIKLREVVVPLRDSHMNDLYTVKDNGWTILGAEKVILEARIPAILKELRKGTIVYTHHVDGIHDRLVGAIRDAGWSVGSFVGYDKSGEKLFKKKKVDILVASSAISTGIDGLQSVCDKIVINELPWTSAEFDQLVGRVWRSGQKNNVEVVTIIAEGEDRLNKPWSADRYRLNRIQYKRTIADAVLDGVYPDKNLISKETAFKHLGEWLEDLRQGNLVNGGTRIVDVPVVSDDSVDVDTKDREYFERPASKITKMNSRWGKLHSSDLHEKLKSNPDEWYEYHRVMDEVKKSWKVVPTDELIKWFEHRKGRVVGDFGCGKALIAKAIGKDCTVHSFDHEACSDSVVACDMVRVPLDDESLDVAIFSLSLMGKNWEDYIKEACRTLRMDGRLWIVEPTRKRFGTQEDTDSFIMMLKSLGFERIKIDNRWKFTFLSCIKEYAC